MPADTDIESAIGNHLPWFAWSAAAPTTLVPFFAQYIGFATFPKVSAIGEVGSTSPAPCGALRQSFSDCCAGFALADPSSRGGAQHPGSSRRRSLCAKENHQPGELPSAVSRFSESRFWAHVKPTAAKCRLRDPLSRNATTQLATIHPSRCGGLRSRKRLHRRDTSRACERRSSASSENRARQADANRFSDCRV